MERDKTIAENRVNILDKPGSNTDQQLANMTGSFVDSASFWKNCDFFGRSF
jgi:hypothetical protein